MNEFSTLSHEELITELALCQRERARLDAREMGLLAALDAEPALAREKQFVRDEVAVALRVSPSYAYGRFELAAALQGLPSVSEALREGRINLDHARAIAEATFGLNAETRAMLEAAVLPYAETHDVYDTRRKVKRELAKLDPFTDAERHRMGLANRRVWVKSSDEPGLWFFGAELPAPGAAELMRALAFMAEQTGEREDESRTKPQRMADALVQLAQEALAGTCSHCERPGRPVGPAVNVTVALSTLLGLDEQPAELNGEQIPAYLARAIAADSNGTWRRLVTDDRGHLIDYGRTTYRPPANLRDHVVARDRMCRFPGCHRKAASCEIDHVVPWEADGTTTAENLIALCPRHHHLKHEAAGWQVELLPEGTVVWTSPTGAVISVDCATYPVDNTVEWIVVVNDNGETELLDPDAWWLTDAA